VQDVLTLFKTHKRSCVRCGLAMGWTAMQPPLQRCQACRVPLRTWFEIGGHRVDPMHLFKAVCASSVALLLSTRVELKAMDSVLAVMAPFFLIQITNVLMALAAHAATYEVDLEAEALDVQPGRSNKWVGFARELLVLGLWTLPGVALGLIGGTWVTALALVVQGLLAGVAAASIVTARRRQLGAT